jgi:hypothetical protein
MRGLAYRRMQQQRMVDKALKDLHWVDTKEQAKKVSNNMRVCSCYLCTHHGTQVSVMRHNVSTHQQLKEI